jgi:hypothetical protein
MEYLTSFHRGGVAEIKVCMRYMPVPVCTSSRFHLQLLEYGIDLVRCPERPLGEFLGPELEVGKGDA